MVWPMIAAAAISLVGGVMQGKGQEKASNKQIAANKEIARLQASEERRTNAYQMELMDYYSQLGAQRNRDARASMYDKYSKIEKPEGFTRTALAAPAPPKPPSTPSSSFGSRPELLPGQRPHYEVPVKE